MTPPAAATAAPVPAVRPRRAPRGPRRVSGPSRPAPARSTRPSAAPRARRTHGASVAAGLPYALVAALAALAQHRVLDRLTDRRSASGRAWIGIVAFALIGIVTLQLGLLKLNGGIGRALERAATLQRENAALSIENSEMAAGLKVETRAGQLGMAFAPTGQLRFLGSQPYEDATKAVAALATAARAAATRASEASSSTAVETSTSSAVGSSSSSSSSESSSGEAATSSSGEAASAQSHESRASGEASGTAEAASAPAREAEASSAAPGTGEASGGGGEAQPSGGAPPTPGG